MSETATPDGASPPSAKESNQTLGMPMSRRAFLGASVASVASYQRILGANDRVQLGFIGCGIIARNHLMHLKPVSDVDIVATCDAYMPRAEQCVADFNPQAKAYQDFRRISEKALECDGRTATRRTFSGVLDGAEWHGVAVHVIHGNMVFGIIGLTSAETFQFQEAIFNKIIKTLHFLTPTTPTTALPNP